jgi:transcriptional regulator with XRE-family HTH domain
VSPSSDDNTHAGAGKSTAHQNVRALLSDLFDSLDMPNPPWRQRLIAAIKADGRSPNRLSLDSGMSRNHVGQFLNDEKGPKIDTLLRICRTLNVSPTFILLGFDIDPASEQILELLSRATPEQRQTLLAFLRAQLRP